MNLVSACHVKINIHEFWANLIQSGVNYRIPDGDRLLIFSLMKFPLVLSTNVVAIYEQGIF